MQQGSRLYAGDHRGDGKIALVGVAKGRRADVQAMDLFGQASHRADVGHKVDRQIVGRRPDPVFSPEETHITVELPREGDERGVVLAGRGDEGVAADDEDVRAGRNQGRQRRLHPGVLSDRDMAAIHFLGGQLPDLARGIGRGRTIAAREEQLALRRGASRDQPVEPREGAGRQGRQGRGRQALLAFLHHALAARLCQGVGIEHVVEHPRPPLALVGDAAAAGAQHVVDIGGASAWRAPIEGQRRIGLGIVRFEPALPADPIVVDLRPGRKSDEDKRKGCDEGSKAWLSV